MFAEERRVDSQYRQEDRCGTQGTGNVNSGRNTGGGINIAILPPIGEETATAALGLHCAMSRRAGNPRLPAISTESPAGLQAPTCPSEAA
jgi:hypothetical protein